MVRPNVDLSEDLWAQVERYAKYRFDGNLDIATRDLLKKALDRVIPDDPIGQLEFEGIVDPRNELERVLLNEWFLRSNRIVHPDRGEIEELIEDRDRLAQILPTDTDITDEYQTTLLNQLIKTSQDRINRLFMIGDTY